MRTIELLNRESPTLSVGILTADLLSLGSELARLDSTGVRVIHIDVMDGCFVPMMTVGPPLIRALRTPLLKDVHLMIRDPLEKVESYVRAGADIVTVHAEAGAHLHRVLQTLGAMPNANDPERGLVRGLALNPGTPVAAVEPVLDEIEMVLLLAVNPGWGGQSFIDSTLDRIHRVRELTAAAGRPILVGVDGGITRDNISRLAGTGVNLVVTGSAVYDGRAPADNARFMLDRLRSGRPVMTGADE
jgi:ribulose-phosphate 3-epimerase